MRFAAITRLPSAWAAYLRALVDDGKPATLAEVVASETVYQSRQATETVDGLHAVAGLLGELIAEVKGLREQTASVDHHTQRIHGAHEREEIFKIRASKIDGMFRLYPLSQMDDVGEYESTLVKIEEYEARKRRIIEGTVGHLPAEIGATNGHH